MLEEKEKLLRLVNSSGFPFQLRVADQIRHRVDSFVQWELLAQEYPWRSANNDHEGFIDIVIRNSQNDRMVLECKRTRDAEWVFLLPKNGISDVGTQAKLLYVGAQAGLSLEQLRIRWHNFQVQPESPISGFCIVRGTGEGQKPMLENLCGILLNSVECFANEESAIAIERKVDHNCLYIPVIVTNANLQVCRFKLGSVSLQDGEIPDGDFESVPYIRFSKSLSTKPIVAAMSISAASRARERTVLVVQSAHLDSFLDKWYMANSRENQRAWM